jgi:hypothetical protein
MSLFDRFFTVPLETTIEREFEEYKSKIDQIIYRENSVLRSLGIKIPRQVRELSYSLEGQSPKYRRVNLITPQFEFPPHRSFIIKKTELVLTLFKELEEAESVYWWWGLGNAFESRFGGIWTNRDPFEFYRLLADVYRPGFTFEQPGVFTDDLSIRQKDSTYAVFYHALQLPKLKQLPGLSPEEASDLHLRMQLYTYVTDNYYVSLQDPQNYYKNGVEKLLPDDTLFKLPVPCTRFKIDEYIRIKVVPSAEAVKPGQMVEFLNSLRGISGNHFFFFELLRLSDSLYFRLSYPKKHHEAIIAKLSLYFPDFGWEEEAANLPSVPKLFNNWVKKTSTYDSIRRLRDFQVDPYAHFARLFEDTAAGELLGLQIIFAPLDDSAAATLRSHLANNNYSEPREFSAKLTKKLPLWFVSINACGTDEQTASSLSNTLVKTTDSPNQILLAPYSCPLTNSSFPQSFPAFLSMFDTEELATLAHFPVTEIPQFRRLERGSSKNVSPPDTYTTGETRIGTSQVPYNPRQRQPVTLPESVRDRHLYIVGKSGTGKSTLMETVARHDIEAGRGVCVIDPHGDMIQHLMETMPDHRVNDCILFSPKHSPVSLEILKAENEHEIDLLTDDLIIMFRRTSESWGDKMQAILQMAFQTLLRIPGSSFADVTPLLTDENYRRRILSKINHPQLSAFWEGRYDMRQAEPILIRMDRLTTSSTLRQVLTQNKNSLNFYDVVQESKIFLADLSKGFLGESTSHLLGSIIVSQIQLAAMRQAHLPIEQRIPFSLFVDEVQNFTTSAFSTILSEARKQKLRLTIAHQFVSQLPQDLQKAVFGNVGTLVFFAMSPDDLGAARHELGTFEPADVANLPKYHALCRPATAARDTFSFVTDPPPPPQADARNLIQSIIEQTRNEYGAVGTAPTVPAATNQPAPASTSNGQQRQPSNAQSNLPAVDRRRPARAEPLVFSTNTDKILHFLRQAEYLRQPQIIALTGLQPSNASTALKKLVDTGQIKTLDDRRPKIYFIGRNCNPTAHNLLVRDLFVKIYNSNYSIKAVKFNDQLSDLNPDLTIEFQAEEKSGIIHTPLLCYFEVDRGTEGVAELLKKAERYSKIKPLPRIGLVFERESDLLLARKTIPLPFIYYATLDSFSSLEDQAFYAGSATASPNTKLPFFGS